MDALIVTFLGTALIPPLVYLSVSAAMKAWRRRREGKSGIVLSPPGKPASLIIPAASETAATVERFHRALMRTDLADFLKPDPKSGA